MDGVEQDGLLEPFQPKPPHDASTHTRQRVCKHTDVCVCVRLQCTTTVCSMAVTVGFKNRAALSIAHKCTESEISTLLMGKDGRTTAKRREKTGASSATHQPILI